MDNVVFFFFLFKSPLPAAALSLKQHHHSRSPPHHYLFILFMTDLILFSHACSISSGMGSVGMFLVQSTILVQTEIFKLYTFSWQSV